MMWGTQEPEFGPRGYADDPGVEECAACQVRGYLGDTIFRRGDMLCDGCEPRAPVCRDCDMKFAPARMQGGRCPKCFVACQRERRAS